MRRFLDRMRAAELMDQAGIEALVLCQPEAFQYATGASMGATGLFRRAGAGFVVIARNSTIPLGIVVADFFAAPFKAMLDAVVLTHPAWIDQAWLEPHAVGDDLGQRIEASMAFLARTPEFFRPATFDIANSVQQLNTILRQFGLSETRIGLDLDFVPASDFAVMQALMPNTLVNGTVVLERLMAIKSEREIDLLRQGIRLSEAGLVRMQRETRPGMHQRDLIGLFRDGVGDAARDLREHVSTIEYVTIGALPKPPQQALEVGDPIKADMICIVNGYGADMSRNFVVGQPSSDQLAMHAIVERAFERGLEAMQPGRRLADIYHAASDSLQRDGLLSYRRGHFGHGVGQSVFSEQWPFISADSDVVIEPGMVLAFEIPLYVDGLASFNLEEQFLVTAGGSVSMNSLPRTLGVI